MRLPIYIAMVGGGPGAREGNGYAGLGGPRGAMPLRPLLLATMVVATSALAGCNLRDWWDIQGTIKVTIVPQGPTNTSLDDFKTLKIALYGVSLKQTGNIDTMEFSYGDDPLIIDMVARGRAGESVQVAETKASLRAIESVTIHIEVVDAVDAAGKSLPACHPGEPVASRPCVSTPKNGAYRLTEVSFSPPRGGEVTYGFPLAVLLNPRANEYFIQADPAKVDLVKDE